MAGTLSFTMLPEDCVSKILSLTSPVDVCRSSLASSSFRSAADSDVVWERLLPSNYQNIVARSISPLKFSSKKELFFRLCDPILIDDGSKSFKIERDSGKKTFILSARELNITQSNEPTHWSWTSLPESRFSQVVVLKTICHLEIQGKIRTQMLSQNTTYGAYLIMKTSESAYGLDSIPSQVSVEVGNLRVSSNAAYLCNRDSKKQQMERLFYTNRVEMLRNRANIQTGEGRLPREREDGWMEIEMGEFFSGEGDQVVKMYVKEVIGNHFKGGLTVEGIEVRPKD